ncbi:MAG TPA: hypothetical protein DIU35_16680 [Candidatus Latescibacteria bacterium]|nr:hypothetical protein [Gemmatimonadota bacterium]HCR19115.1 hypothetical protein [Candidatus Latescibacterota bacterium]|tara:strand:- start:2203 stop:3141 length:939 start_codon:yes stop_codon:yes gene_type:complete
MPIKELLLQIDAEKFRGNLHHISSDPLPFRKLSYTRPGQSRNSLYEADDFISETLGSYGYGVEKEAVQVQSFRCDTSKPKANQYSAPDPDDPWYTAYNLYAEISGNQDPDEIILLLAHKDSQSWVDSPGAYDNGAGTVALMEIARVLAKFTPNRTIRFLFCNEEHRPWTSVTAAVNAKERGDNLVAIYNLDSMGGKSQEDVDAHNKIGVTLYTCPEGEQFADLMATVNQEYAIGLDQRKYLRERPGDDDGSFINAGFPHAVANIGSYPYADPTYHTEEDVPDRVDIPNLVMSTQATLAAILTIDLEGVGALT